MKVDDLIGEGEATHPTLDAEHVVVRGEHVHGRAVLAGSLESNRNLRIINAGEIACASGLMFLGLEGEGIGVHTRVGGAGMVVERLDLVEILTLLLLEAILTVEDKLEGIKRTDGGRSQRRTILNKLA